jgi:hypothetical protein
MFTGAGARQRAAGQLFLSALSRGIGDGTFLPLPCPDTIRHPLVEVCSADESLDAAKPHSFPHLVAHTGEGESDALTLQLSDVVEQVVAAARIDEIH